MLRIGPAGKPLSYRGDFIDVVDFLRSHGLGVIEVEFVRGIWMKEDAAWGFKEKLKEADIIATIHAPYYINLLGNDDVRERSRQRIIKCLHTGQIFGAKVVVFHPGYYGKRSPEDALKEMKEEIEILLEESKKTGVQLAPETTGKVKQFGSLDELIELSGEYGIPFTLDFAHLHAREGGLFKEADDFRRVLDKIERELGSDFLRTLHVHFSGIQYGRGGEIRHLPIESKSPDYEILADVLGSYDVSEATFISESPLIEKDAWNFARILKSRGIRVWGWEE